ncbi:hypothetical protein DL769_001918 [Monosporascus sp. CRB-8-3]|nr:hypothetical protein DL769_001918 [Monosporascus sp. CRB-8-3]
MQFSITFITAAIAGLSTAAPTLEERYVPGACGIHVTQYQKNQGGVGSEYKFTVTIKDAVDDIIGGIRDQAIADFQSTTVFSELPHSLVITVGSVDDDPVRFAYAGHIFSSSTGCSIGGYENGNREMDCGFTC